MSVSNIQGLTLAPTSFTYFDGLPLPRPTLPELGRYWDFSKISDTFYSYFNSEAFASYATTIQKGLSTGATQIAHYWNESGIADFLATHLNQEALNSYMLTTHENLLAMISHPAFFSVVLPAVAITPFVIRVFFSQIDHPRVHSFVLFMRKPIFTILSAGAAGCLLTSPAPHLFMLGVVVCGCQIGEVTQIVSNYFYPNPTIGNNPDDLGKKQNLPKPDGKVNPNPETPPPPPPPPSPSGKKEPIKPDDSNPKPKRTKNVPSLDPSLADHVANNPRFAMRRKATNPDDDDDNGYESPEDWDTASD